MMALEELSENDERLAFLTTQREDITRGIASTRKPCAKSSAVRASASATLLRRFNRNFSDLFQELFGGGRGEMSPDRF